MEQSTKGNQAKTIVKIMDYNPSNHTVRVVKVKDNQPLEDDVWMAKKIEQEKLYEKKISIALKASTEAEGAILEVEAEQVSMKGSSKNGFFSTRNDGNIIKGPISFEAEPHEIKFSGFHIMNPLVTSGFASTIVTPIPFTLFSFPGAGMIKKMAEDIAIMTPLLAMGV